MKNYIKRFYDIFYFKDRFYVLFIVKGFKNLEKKKSKWG